MKIALINPVSEKKGAVDVGIPTGLFALASWLENLGHDILLVDGPLEGLTPDQVVEQVVEFNPLIAGFGPMTPQLKNSVRIAWKLKEKIPGINIVFGGPHITFSGIHVLRHYPVIDFIVAGEGEIAFSQLIEHIASGSRRPPFIDGVSCYSGSELTDGGMTKPIQLNESPPFADHLLKLSLYAEKDKGEFGPTFSAVRIMTGRGCRSRCEFCVVHKMNPGGIRHYPVEHVLTHLENIQKAGIRFIKFADDSFGSDSTFTTKLAEGMIARKLNLRFEIESRLDLLEESQLLLLKKAGLEGVWFGIESMDDELRKSMVKGLPKETIIKGVALLKKLEIRSSAFFLTGIPGQTRESIINDAKEARKLDLDLAVFSILTPYPGTPIGENPESYGIRVLDEDPDNWTEMVPVIETDNLTREELSLATKDGYKHFFLDPEYTKSTNSEFRTRMQGFVKNVILA